MKKIKLYILKNYIFYFSYKLNIEFKSVNRATFTFNLHKILNWVINVQMKKTLHQFLFDIFIIEKQAK